MDWNNRTVFITGATTGIGKATKDLLRAGGAKVYCLDIVEASDDDAAYFIYCDVRIMQSVADAIHRVYEKEKKIDMLFANAGIHFLGSIEDTDEESLHNVIGVNVLGVFHSLKSVLPIMKKQQRGSIVLTGSDQCFIGKASSAAYGLTKGAIGQLTKSTAVEYAAYNIRVNCICPGSINTPFLDRVIDQFAAANQMNVQEVQSIFEKDQPLGRIGQPAEIAAAVAFLLSDESAFTTGSLLSVDGGYVAQ